MEEMNKRRKPVVLIILDGWGIAPASSGNAIALAKTPNIDYFWNNYPRTILKAHGKNAGLPDNQVGNSEAGHLNLGAGRMVEQEAVYICETIKDGTFFKNPAFKEAIDHAAKHKSKLHLIGLLTGNESSHAYPEHLYALLKLTKNYKVGRVFLHLFTDGRDSSPYGAIKYLDELKKNFTNGEKIASISGRFYAMDRKKNWESTEKVYNVLVSGEGEKVDNPKDALLKAYNKGLTDEFIPPSVITKNGKPIGNIADNDAVIFFNLRSDRARQLTKVFVQEDFSKLNAMSFRKKKNLKNIKFIAMTDFGPDLPNLLTAFPSRDIANSLPCVLKGLKQLYIAETEKYAHVTYFFNGGYANPVAGEERMKVPSPEAVSYDETPEMSAYEITKVAEKKIRFEDYDFILINFANADMVGHTGNLKAGIKACEAVDECAGKVVNEVLKKGGAAVITADHGNIEEIIDLKTGEIDTKHSINPVPLIIVGNQFKNKKIKLNKGILGDVAPTILDLMNIKKPKEMKGRTLMP